MRILQGMVAVLFVCFVLPLPSVGIFLYPISWPSFSFWPPTKTELLGGAKNFEDRIDDHLKAAGFLLSMSTLIRGLLDTTLETLKQGT